MIKYSNMYRCIIGLVVAGALTSCFDSKIPDHFLDVEFQYELTCSEHILKYVTPEVSITDATGKKNIFTIDEEMWEGVSHKKWKLSIHYDSLNVSNTLSVRYIPKIGVVYQDEVEFDSFHDLNCLIMVMEDGNGARNNYTIVPDFPSLTDVTASALESYIENLSAKTYSRGGTVGLNGEITKMDNN